MALDHLEEVVVGLCVVDVVQIVVYLSSGFRVVALYSFLSYAIGSI